jgi:hypothetical protein
VGTTIQLKLGGQGLDDISEVLVTGTGVTGRVVDYQRRIGPQEIQLLREQSRDLRRATSAKTAAKKAAPQEEMMMMMADMAGGKAPAGSGGVGPTVELAEKVDRRIAEWVQTPACASIASLVYVDLTIAPEAELGQRELRLVTARGVSNPLAFHVGELREYARTPMRTASIQILGKEALALRKRPAEEAEQKIALPCTVNGQIASGELNRYRFEASKGQRIVISTKARQLVPYIADAVPGWFQPVLALYDAQGRELEYSDDFRFMPDPVIVFEVPKDGEYVFAIQDSIYRGREDFVYRITVGELPFVTSLFPLGAQVGAAVVPAVEGVNLWDASLGLPPPNSPPGVRLLAAGRMGYESNRVPFALDRLADEAEKEPNNGAATAQKISLPTIINGRIDRPDDWDVYEFVGKANARVAIEVQARRLDSPLDSVVKLTDAKGRMIAFSDDREDLTAGTNTHHADSGFVAKLPADGLYHVHIGDTARQGGSAYGYRLRISPPQPDFELRVVPSSVSLPANSSATVTVYALRKDGFDGQIRLGLKSQSSGITAAPVTMTGAQTVMRVNLRSGPLPTKEPAKLVVTGTAKVGNQDLVREAVPAEDRMQAFLWRHLVPAQDLQVVVYNRNVQPTPRRVPPPRPAVTPVVAATPSATPVAAVATTATTSAPTTSAGATTTGTTSGSVEANKPKFTKQQIAGRVRQLRLLYEEGLLTDEFFDAKMAECEVAQ